MCAVFGRKSGEEVFYDGLSLQDGFETRNFTARIVVGEGRAVESIQGGRITGFMLFDSDPEYVLCHYEKGYWFQPIDPNDTVACFALSHFLADWNVSGKMTRASASQRYFKALDGSDAFMNHALMVPEEYSRKKHPA